MTNGDPFSDHLGLLDESDLRTHLVAPSKAAACLFAEYFFFLPAIVNNPFPTSHEKSANFFKAVGLLRPF